jgi:hypothetical protein
MGREKSSAGEANIYILRIAKPIGNPFSLFFAFSSMMHQRML